MSLQTILDTIEAAGADEIAQLQAETAAHTAQILADASQTAARRREVAEQAAASPAAGERAQCLHQAKLEALQVVAAARDGLVASALEQTERHLRALRGDSVYAPVLRGLIDEAVRLLGDEEINSLPAFGDERAWLEIDASDEALVRSTLAELALDLAVRPTLRCWGGIILCSSDGRIIVTNTLESRLERAKPYLRQELAAFFETSAAPVLQEAAVS